jgi:hypothetical protein
MAEDNESSDGGSQSAAATLPEPIYGEGMTLIQPDGFIIDASSQSGTWVEEKEEARAVLPSSSPATPALLSRKSQRLDSNAAPIFINESQASTANGSSPPKSYPSEPAVDDFTVLLGVGWTRLNAEDVHIQAAARGWSRYIENHFPLNDVSILLQSKGLSSYLVGCSEGFFLFHEDLGEGRLLGRTFETTMHNLRRQPAAFEGADSVHAIGTPRDITQHEAGEENIKDELEVIHEESEHEPAGQEFTMDLD